MALRYGLVTGVLGLLFAGMWSVPHAAADPAWNLVETGCTSFDGGCPNGFYPFTLPLVLGSVSGTGTYFDDAISGVYTFSDSGDFTIHFPFFVPTPDSGPYCIGPVAFGCFENIDISLIDGPGGLDGYIDFHDHLDEIVVDLNFYGTTFSGLWSSDGPLLGCGVGSACTISGELDPVPEPSSLPVLLAGLSMIGGVAYLRRKNMRAGPANPS